MHEYFLLSLGLWSIKVCFIFCCRFCSSDIFRACEHSPLWNTVVICHLDRQKSCINMREQKIFSFYCAMTGIVKLLSHLVLYFPWGVEDSSSHNSCVWLAQRGATSAQSSAPVFTKVPVIWGLLWSHWRNESQSVGAAAPQAGAQRCHCHHSSPHVPSSTGGQTGFWTSCKKCIHCHECTAVTHWEDG